MKDFLESSKKIFGYYRELGEKTLEQVPEDMWFWSPNEDSNSLALLIQHMAGNMRSRWTDFLTSDGEKPWRKRDREFEPEFNSAPELMAYWKEGWECLEQALEPLAEDDLGKTVYIRNQVHTVLEAIQRQLAHLPYHVGQMVYLGKVILGDQWNSLSIPKGKSEEFNKGHFSRSKEKKHFTDK